jgi:hypothetical protein
MGEAQLLQNLAPMATAAPQFGQAFILMVAAISAAGC